MEKVGSDRVITVEEGKSMGVELEVVEECNLIAATIPYMVTDTDKMEAVLDEPYLNYR